MEWYQGKIILLQLLHFADFGHWEQNLNLLFSDEHVFYSFEKDVKVYLGLKYLHQRNMILILRVPFEKGIGQ